MITPELAYPVMPTLPTAVTVTRQPVVSVTPSTMGLSSYLSSSLIGMTHRVWIVNESDFATCTGMRVIPTSPGYALSCYIPGYGSITAAIVLTGRLGDAPTNTRLAMIGQSTQQAKTRAQYEARESVAIQGLFGADLTSESPLQSQIQQIPDTTLPVASNAETMPVVDAATGKRSTQSVVVIRNQLFTDQLVPLALTLEYQP